MWLGKSYINRETIPNVFCFNYSAPDSEAEYCDERMCVCVCVRVCVSVHDHIFGTARPIFTKFFVYVIYDRGSVVL